MNYAFHPEARREFREALLFYESRCAGLGTAFRHRVDDAIVRILEAPDRWPRIVEDVRRCLVGHSFPYSVIYLVEDDTVLIIAIAHSSRKPGYWKERLSP